MSGWPGCDLHYGDPACPPSQGADLVLNSLAEEKLQASVRCLAQHGRFLEIGKFDLSKNHPLGEMGRQAWWVAGWAGGCWAEWGSAGW